MATAVIEISTMVEISFCEALMRMSFAGYEPIMIAAIEVISVRAFSEVLSPHPTVMCHCTGVHVPASAHASGVSHRTHASGMSHRSGVHCACATHASSMSHRTAAATHVATAATTTMAATTSSASASAPAPAPAAMTNESNAIVRTIENGKACRVGGALQ